jgi:hypothetical protein
MRGSSAAAERVVALLDRRLRLHASQTLGAWSSGTD